MARRQFTERGFKGTALDAIAVEAGCAKGALYLEFESKETLLRAVVEETFAAIRTRFAAEVEALASPLARLGETLRVAYRQMLREDPELRALAPGDADGRAAQAQVEQLARWVDEGIACGEIRPDVDRDIVPYAIGVLRFAPQHLAVTDALGLMSSERVLEGLVELFMSGLAARGKSSRPPARERPVAAAAKRKEKRR